ncbi:MAG: TonB-dependent receptor, partial [Acidobacteriaceae bacterium]
MTHRLMKVCVLLLCGIFAVAAFAQNTNATISGTVQDTHNAVIPGATIDLTNVGTAQTLSTTAGGNGFYTFSNLGPADYKVSVSAPGFAQWVGTLTLRVSQAASINAQLTAASVSTKVTVRDVTPVIDRVNATISDVKNATTIETLPVQNRNILNVLAFSPGVVANSYGGSGAGFTRVNGIPGGSLSFLVDGQTAGNRFSNELETNSQPLPTYQEVKITTTSGDAQYERPGTVELVTKSGTNQFHGQAFELNQNNYLRAKQAFSGPTVNYLMHNEFGGQVGGPIKRDHTFFFVDAEWIRENSNANASSVQVPTDFRTGNLSGLVDAQGLPITVYDPLSTSSGPAPYTRTAFAGNVIPANRLNPVSQLIFNKFLPQPNITGVNYWKGDPNYRPTNASASNRNKLFTAKVDQLFGPNRLAMRYSYAKGEIVQPNGGPYILEPFVTRAGSQNGAVVFTQVIGTHAVNVMRTGVAYNHRYQGPQPINPSPTDQLGLPTYNSSVYWPSFYFQGQNDGYWDGIDRANPQDFPDATISGSDQLSYNRGNHQLMFGFKVSNSRLTTTEIGQPGGGYGNDGLFTALQDPAKVAGGTFSAAVPDTGSGLADFLLGDMDYLFVNTYPIYHSRQTEFGGFVQDNWRASERLTLNLGLRYGYWTAFAESSGRQSTFDPTVPGGMVVYQGSGTLPAYTTQAIYDSFVAAGLPIKSAAAAGFPLSLWNMP